MEGFPLTKQLTCTIKKKQFDLIVQSFGDEIFVVVTEKGRVGQIVKASSETNLTSSKIHYKTEIMMGMDTDFANVLARRLIEDITKSIGNTRKQLLLGVAFDKSTQQDFQMLGLIVHCINKIKLW